MKTSNPLKIRVSLTFLRKGVNAFISFGRQVVTNMTGNTNYTTPEPTLAAVTTGLDDLQAKMDAAAVGGKVDMDVRNTAWEASIMQLRSLATYVQLNCQNDLDILQSAGFVSTKTPAPVGPLPAPENLRSSYTGTSGEVILRINRVLGVTAGYTYQQADSPAGPFATIGVSNKTRFTATGLTPAKTYWFQACANGAAGPSGPCSAISVIAI